MAGHPTLRCDRARSEDASHLSADGGFRAGAIAITGRVARSAVDRTEHDALAGLRATGMRVRRFFLAALFVFISRFAFAQGGPPMITDDPGTPGNGKWENNLAIAFSHVPNEWSIDAPAIDLNYGWGDHIQLTLQGGPALLKRSGHGLVGGIGGTEAAVKWRFLDEEKSGFDVSMFPRILFNVLNSSVRRGLAEDGTRFQIPFQAAKKVGPVGLDVEFGPLISSVGGSEFIYGIVAGKELSKTTSLMAEVHATSRVNLSHDVVTLNFGCRHKLSEHAIWIASVGHDVHSGEDAPLALIGYCGVQLLY
jgi:hypothetical protein